MRMRQAAALLLVAIGACQQPVPRPRPGTVEHGLIGFIDTPMNGSTVGPEFVVAGWAAGHVPVDRVRIYLDDELMAVAPIESPRPDVDRDLPQYASSGPLHGFGVNIDVGRNAGYRVVRVEAIDRRGSACYVASINVKIDP